MVAMSSAFRLTGGQLDLPARQPSLWLRQRRWLCARARLVLALLGLLGLAACSAIPASQPVLGDQSGGGSTPELVAQNFFEDLGRALRDQQIGDEERRSKWVEQLSNYFTPSERDDMRVAFSTALDTFVEGQGKLAENEQLTLDVKFDGIEQVSNDGSRALVRPINGSIYVLITRTTTTGGTYTLWEQNKSLSEIIGNPDGAVPVTRVGRVWFLTEG